MLKQLIIYDWNQFDKVNIEFDRKVTIITGVNGSGKSSIIRLLSKLIGWDYTEIVNKFNKKTSLEGRLSRDIQKMIKEEIHAFNEKKEREEISEEEEIKGKIETNINTYTLSITDENLTNDDDLMYEMSVIPKKEAEYSDQVDYGLDFTFEKGINVPSHRMPYFYNPTEYVSSKKLKRNEFYSQYKFELMRRQVTGYDYDSDNQPQQYIKSSLITLAMYSGDNKNVEDSRNKKDIFTGFTEILKIILPKTLKFKRIKVIDGEVVLVTDTGNFLIDAVSGGIGALIDLAWQIFMGKPENEKESFFVLIDEIENHLHPSMQRSILPDLVNAFPNIQFIVTTHSPFVINSIEDAKVIALKYNDRHKVISNELDLCTQYSSAMEVLREILDVPVLMPIWLEKKLDKILTRHKSNLNIETYHVLKEELKEEGLESLMPYTIEQLSKEIENDSTL